MSTSDCCVLVGAANPSQRSTRTGCALGTPPATDPNRGLGASLTTALWIEVHRPSGSIGSSITPSIAPKKRSGKNFFAIDNSHRARMRANAEVSVRNVNQNVSSTYLANDTSEVRPLPRLHRDEVPDSRIRTPRRTSLRPSGGRGWLGGLGTRENLEVSGRTKIRDRDASDGVALHVPEVIPRAQLVEMVLVRRVQKSISRPLEQDDGAENPGPSCRPRPLRLPGGIQDRPPELLLCSVDVRRGATKNDSRVHLRGARSVEVVLSLKR